MASHHTSIHFDGTETFHIHTGAKDNHSSLRIEGERLTLGLVLPHRNKEGKAGNANWLHNLISELTNLAVSLEAQAHADEIRAKRDRTAAEEVKRKRLEDMHALRAKLLQPAECTE